MRTKTSIDIGTVYLTHEGVAVTPIKALPNQRALFVTSEFYPTLFVSWEYSLQDGHIVLYSGNYFQTLEQALIAESNRPGPIRLSLSFYCPECETTYVHEFSCNTTVQELVEQIEDTRIVCPKCGYTHMGIHSIAITDKDTTYDMPLWHGPITNDGIVSLDE